MVRKEHPGLCLSVPSVNWACLFSNSVNIYVVIQFRVPGVGLILCLALCPLGFLFVHLFSELNNKSVCVLYLLFYMFYDTVLPLPAVVFLP